MFQKSKTNRIIIDSENKNTEIKDEDRSQENNTSKIYSKSNFEKKNYLIIQIMIWNLTKLKSRIMGKNWHP